MEVHKDLFNSARIGKNLQLSEKIVLATYMKVGYDSQKNLRYNNNSQTVINKNNGKRKTVQYHYTVLSIDIFHYELRENITFPYLSIIAIIFIPVKNVEISMSRTPTFPRELF